MFTYAYLRFVLKFQNILLHISILMVTSRLFSIHLLLQTLEALKRICPKQALLIGMTHNFDHLKDNEFLMEWSER